MRHLRGANEFERVSSSIYGLDNFRSSALQVPMIAVLIFSTFNISSASCNLPSRRREVGER